jgi:hypothetical protein
MNAANLTAEEIATANARALHPFERAGLGKAPFYFVGLTEKTYQACHGAPVQPGGTCAFCGTGIRYCCQIKSADGARFVVGCDCVQRLADERNDGSDTALALRKLAAVVSAAERKIAAQKRAQKAAGVLASIETSLADAAIRATLETRPHPRAFAGLSLLNWCEWMLANAGAKGRAEVAKAIKAATTEK